LKRGSATIFGVRDNFCGLSFYRVVLLGMSSSFPWRCGCSVLHHVRRLLLLLLLGLASMFALATILSIGRDGKTTIDRVRPSCLVGGGRLCLSLFSVGLFLRSSSSSSRNALFLVGGTSSSHVCPLRMDWMDGWMDGYLSVGSLHMHLDIHPAWTSSMNTRNTNTPMNNASIDW
jgi:hypothetical protein